MMKNETKPEECKVPPPATKAQSRRALWLGGLAIVLTIGLSVLIVVRRDILQDLSGYGYIGLFLISALGGALTLIPVPMLAVQFAMGGVLLPPFGPAVLGPLFAGTVAGMAETVGGISLYLTGRSGRASFNQFGEGWLGRMYRRLEEQMNRHGAVTLFLISAIINPFFFPVSLAAGACQFGLKRYSLICLAGKLIKCNFVAFAGYFGLRSLFGALGIAV